MNKLFKTSMFGYKKKIVNEYIENLSNKTQQSLDESEDKIYDMGKEITALKEKIAELEGAVSGDTVAVESVSSNACSSQEAFSAEQISVATGKLKCVADELCQSINDLIEKINEGGAEVSSEEKTDSDEAAACTDEPTDKVQSILGRVSSIFTNKSKL